MCPWQVLRSGEAPLVAESDAEVLQADIDKLQVRPRECLHGGMLQLMLRKPEQPMAKPTEIALNVDDQQPCGAPTEIGSIDPPSNVLKIIVDAVEPPAALDHIFLTQRHVRGFLTRRRVKQEVRRDCAPPEGKATAVTLSIVLGTSPCQVSRCGPMPPAAARAVR